MGFFSERRLLAYKHTRTHLLLMTFFKCYWIVFLWELSTPPHTHTHSSTSLASPPNCLQETLIPSLEMSLAAAHALTNPGLSGKWRAQKIHTFTPRLGKQKPREGCRTPLAKYICVAFLTVKRLDWLSAFCRKQMRSIFCSSPGYYVTIRVAAVSRQTTAIPKTSQEWELFLAETDGGSKSERRGKE